MINGIEVTSGPVDNAYYSIEFEFDLRDKDGFVLQTVHAKDLAKWLASGAKNTFQATVEDAIPYATGQIARAPHAHPGWRGYRRTGQWAYPGRPVNNCRLVH